MREDARSRFSRARTFAVYYGRDRLRELALFDVCIIEPAAHTREEVEGLLRAGALPVAYLSCMEWGEHLAHYGEPDARDYLRVRGGRVYRPEFSTWVMDLGSPGWRRIVLDRAADLLSSGYQGLFLDTIGDVEDPRLGGALSRALTKEASDLVLEIRKAHGSAILIQNNGLERLIECTAPYVDAVCWESVSLALADERVACTWAASKARDLSRLKKEHGLGVMLLDSALSSQMVARVVDYARAHGFLCYVARESYVDEIDAPCA